MDESMITGESIFVSKTSIASNTEDFNEKKNKNNFLFAGTYCVNVRANSKNKNTPVLGLVYKTGFNTTKGNIIRSILYSSDFDFKFNRDAYKFVFILAAISIIGLIIYSKKNSKL